MKKVLISLFAVAAMVSCANDELVELNQEAISFENAFVENNTRATDDFTILKTNLGSFSVWGTTKGNEDGAAIVPIFTEELVSSTDSGNTWTYGITQYWIAGNAYEFVALKNYDATTVNVENGLPTKFTYTYNDAAPKDVVAAKASATGLATGNPAVSFTFDHLLAKAFFTLENTITTNTTGNVYTYEITDVKVVTPTTANGAFNGTNWVWEDHDANTAVAFGNSPKVGAVGTAATSGTAEKARLMIPYNHAALAISCTINTYYNGTLVDVRPYSKTIAKNIEMGNVYNFKFSLGAPGEPIEFTVNSVDAWVDAPVALPQL